MKLEDQLSPSNFFTKALMKGRRENQRVKLKLSQNVSEDV